MVFGKSLGILESVVNAANLNTNTLFPSFLLTFEILNYNFHNFSVDSSAYANVMPLSMYRKINAEIKPSDLKII